MPTDPAEFVRQVMQDLNCETPTELAQALGMGSYWSPKRITRWLDGESAPNYAATRVMLEKAGRLRDGAAPTTRPETASFEERLAEVLRRLEQVAVRIEAALADRPDAQAAER